MAIVVERQCGYFVIIFLAVVLAVEIDALMQSSVVIIMSLIGHNHMAELGAGHHHTRGGIGKGLNDHILLVGNDHKAHALLPVAQTDKTEVLFEKVLRFGLLNGFVRLRILGHSHLLGSFGLHNITVSVALSLSSRHDKRAQQTHQKSFHISQF